MQNGNINKAIKENLVFFYADDDPDDLAYFKDALSDVYSHATLQTHADGQYLMDALKNPPPVPYIVFLDLNMPVKNGFEVLQDVNDSKDLNRTRIIVFSTSNDRKIIEQCKNLGAAMYIIKPNSYEGLKKSITHVLNTDWDNYHNEKKPFVVNF